MEKLLEFINNITDIPTWGPLLFVFLLITFVFLFLWITNRVAKFLTFIGKSFKGATIVAPGGSTISLGNNEEKSTGSSEENNNASEKEGTLDVIFLTLFQKGVELGIKNAQKRAELFNAQLDLVHSAIGLIKSAVLGDSKFNTFPKNLEIILDDCLGSNFKPHFRKICVKNHIAQKDIDDFIKESDGFIKSLSMNITRDFLLNAPSDPAYQGLVDACKKSLEDQKSYIEDQAKKCLKNLHEKANIFLGEQQQINEKILKSINNYLFSYTKKELKIEDIPDIPVDTVGGA